MSRFRTIPAAVILALASLPFGAFAQMYGGPGLIGGISAAATIVPSRPLPVVIMGIMNAVLGFMAVAATIAIIVAGIYLITGNGNEEAKTKAKNIVIYTIVGLALILLAELIVQVVMGTVAGNAAPLAAFRNKILGTLNVILSFLAALAAIFIIVAGIRLIVSQGEDEQKGKAKNTIIHVVIGLIVVLVAKVIVMFVINAVQS